MTKIRNHWKNKKGITLVWGAFFLVFMLMFAGMAIDLAYMYFVKNQLQVAADASALAGVAFLDGTASTTQEDARRASWKFACKNKAAGTKVFLVTSTPPDCDTLTPPAATALNGGNVENGDIVVGYWDPTTPFTPTIPTGRIANAVKVVARRTSADAVTDVSIGNNPVGVFIGQVFRYFGGAGWPSMNPAASAIAARPPRPTSGIAICPNTCTLATPFTLDFSEQMSDSPYGIAWTEFSTANPQTPQSCLNPPAASCQVSNTCGQNPGELIASYIWHVNMAPYACVPIKLNNGVGDTTKDLECAFKTTSFDTANKNIVGGVVQTWTVIVPVIESCPSVHEPGPWNVIKFAEMDITNVDHKFVTVSRIHCLDCGDFSLLGHTATLVK